MTYRLNDLWPIEFSTKPTLREKRRNTEQWHDIICLRNSINVLQKKSLLTGVLGGLRLA